MHKEAPDVAVVSGLKTQMQRFLVAGFSAVAVDTLVYFALSPRVFPHAPAKALSFLAGTCVAYVLNKFYTFARPERSAGEMARFGGLYAVTLLLNVTTNAAVLDLLGPAWRIAAFLGATGASTVVNFVGQKFWVFRPSSAPMAQPVRWIDYTPFLAMASVACCVLAVSFPSLFVHGEMFAEAGNDYFPTAHFAPLWQKLTALDYVYWPLVGRVLALLVEWSPLPVSLVPFAYQGLAMTIIALSCASFALPACRKIVPNDWARLVVCLGLVFQPDAMTKAFINAPYYLAIPYFLFLVLLPGEKTMSQRQACGWGMLLAVAGLSKPHFLAFVPALGLLGLWSLRRKRWDVVTIVSMALAALALQLGIMATHRPPTAAPADPALMLSSIGMQLWGVLSQAWAGKVLYGMPHWTPNVVAGALGVAIATYAVMAGLRRDGLRGGWLLGVGLLTTVAAMTLTVASYPDTYALRAFRDFNAGLLISRHCFVATVVLYMTVALLVGRGLRQPALLVGTLACWLMATHPFGLTEMFQEKPKSYAPAHYSTWRHLAPVLMQTGRGCVPINPYPWMLSVKCTYLLPPPALESLQGPTQPLRHQGYVAPVDAKQWQVDTIGVLLRGPQRTTTTMSLVAYDEQGRELSRALPYPSDRDVFTFFHFADPVHGIVRVQIVGTDMSGVELVQGSEATGAPLWLWLGNGDAPDKRQG